jgi:hypothetical protein
MNDDTLHLDAEGDMRAIEHKMLERTKPNPEQQIKQDDDWAAFFAWLEGT